MPFCPVCKLEYVEGKTECPDCKAALVASLDDIKEETSEVDEMTDEEVLESATEEMLEANMDPSALLKKLRAAEASNDYETVREIYETLRSQVEKNSPYENKKDKYSENKSASYILTIAGAIGAIILILNGFNVIHLPLNGFSEILLNVVMGLLFFIFLLTGIKGFMKLKKISVEVDEEKENTDKLLEYLKAENDKGSFKVEVGEGEEEMSVEEASLLKSDKAVSMAMEQFPDFKENFCFYVVDRYYSEIFDED